MNLREFIWGLAVVVVVSTAPASATTRPTTTSGKESCGKDGQIFESQCWRKSHVAFLIFIHFFLCFCVAAFSLFSTRYPVCDSLATRVYD